MKNNNLKILREIDMGFISKVELKRQLQRLGIKVEGDYVQKKDIEKISIGYYEGTGEDRNKKVKCIDNKGFGAEKKLTIGKIYTVLDSNTNGYKVRDDTNQRRFYNKTRFEIEK